MAIIRLNRNSIFRRLTIGVLVTGLLSAGPVWADPAFRNKKGPYPETGKIFKHIPADRDIVHVGPEKYFFHNGVFYNRDPKGYRVVRPPRGTVVHHLPLGFETLLIAGITYFLVAGIYYQKTNSGYEVVDAPGNGTAVRAAEPAGSVQIIAVNAKLLNVRSGPGMDHPVVSQVRMNDRLEVKGSASGWYYVRLPNGTFGWVMAGYTRQIVSDAKG